MKDFKKHTYGKRLYMANRINNYHFNEILGFEISKYNSDRINNYNLLYEDLTLHEKEKYFIHVLEVLTSEIVKSGSHRIDDWEKGWGENLELFKNTHNIDSLIPKYHGKNRYVRWMGDIVNPLTENFDYKIHICFIDSILDRYISSDICNIYEFGCGPGYHLLRLRDRRPDLSLHGLDWAVASQNLISEINKNLNSRIIPYNFNFFNPDYNIKIKENSLIYSIAALEQIGSNFMPFIDYVLQNKPRLCIHMEPIEELLNKEKFIDQLSIKYFHKRNYLNGYLPCLEKLQSQGKVEIIDKRRIYSGSYFIEGHSLIAWRPL
jgi:hypothetical protein